MHKMNGTPAAKLDPVEVLRAQVAQSLREKFTAIEIRPATARTLLRSLMAECDAKASALDALVEAVTLATEAFGATAALDADAYQNTPGVDRAWESRIIAFSAAEDAIAAALSAAKLAQVSK